ncbi:hypothetical protein FOXB_10423 [Fusarium oxysporum f. sp. conglutinans Fo5176]|uniref:Uncharacterized protein n=1 Tax=Fusarium oxysporum (strain Fo5176) TaxID=660025 RepID=F9FVJ2_FUSOF|nr:hypothetical protein FOXB_10423 [Fusarium oxysporum f. sp. conglutinans Fo5176]
MRNRGMIRDLAESIQSIFCLYNQLNASVTLISPWYPYDASIFPVAYSKFHLLQSGTSSHFRLPDPHWPQSLKLVDHSTVPMVNFLTTHQGQVTPACRVWIIPSVDQGVCLTLHVKNLKDGVAGYSNGSKSYLRRSPVISSFSLVLRKVSGHLSKMSKSIYASCEFQFIEPTTRSSQHR